MASPLPAGLPLALDLAALAQREPARVVEGRVGERREHVRHLARPELSGEVREADLEGHAPLHAAQRPDEGVDVLGLFRRERPRPPRPAARARAPALGRPRAKKTRSAMSGMRRERLAQEGAGAEQRAHGAHAEGIVGERADVRARA